MKPNYIKKEHLDLEQRAKDIPENIRNKIRTIFKLFDFDSDATKEISSKNNQDSKK